jgi:hypothetical protein
MFGASSPVLPPTNRSRTDEIHVNPAGFGDVCTPAA